MMIEVARKVGNATPLKIEVVHVDVEALPVLRVEVPFGVLKEKCCLADTSRTFYTNHAVVPVDLIHKGAMDWCIDVLHEVSVRPEKSLH